MQLHVNRKIDVENFTTGIQFAYWLCLSHGVHQGELLSHTLAKMNTHKVFSRLNSSSSLAEHSCTPPHPKCPSARFSSRTQLSPQHPPATLDYAPSTSHHPSSDSRPAHVHPDSPSSSAPLHSSAPHLSTSCAALVSQLGHCSRLDSCQSREGRF